jgi:hypothetical protein
VSREVRYFGPNHEPAVLVTDFRELSAGVVVYDVACTQCHRSACRGVLVTMHETETAGLDGICDGYAWELQPPCCDPGEGHFSGVSPEQIAARHIFAVIDEPPAKAESRTRRRKLVTS